MPVATPAYLSVRLPVAARDRLKVAAAARGETVQELVGNLVERFLAEEGRKGPDLATVLAGLRDHAADLQKRGVSALWVFGSVARGEAQPGSDVDLMADLDPGAHLSLVGLASLRAALTDAIGAPADLVDRAALRPAARQAAEREAVRAW